jgi:hypothetical protein
VMDRNSALVCLSITLVVCCFSGGCGTRESLVPVEGVVTLDGKPLSEATVVLNPMTATAPGPFSGTTDAEGRFTLSPTGSPGTSGAVPGAYRLYISTAKYAPVEGADDSAKPKILAPERVPDEYRLGNMQFEVPADGTTTANFNIQVGGRR